MTPLKQHYLKTLSVALVGGSLFAGLLSAVDAAPRHSRSNAALNAYGSAPPSAGERPAVLDNARASALHECNAAVAGKAESTWGVQVSTAYRSCMAQHGQPE